ncbi:MAG: hydroxymethylglutaryl-CoA lyase [Endozoicomonadaceae bacterium]|nr:hydroxymethylglutaryl-CoA lyase [Endozoicomonadaceae bacterium]
MNLPDKVTLVEVGPRDGLQNQSHTLTPAERVEFIERLSQAGLSQIEAGSFVSPTQIPQMANTDQVFAGLKSNDAVRYFALVPNLQGLEAAIDAGVKDIAVFTAASDTFTHKNINCSIAESLDRIALLMPVAQQTDLRVRGYVSCTLGCPYEGEIHPERVAEVAKALVDLGCYEISLGDTVGMGTPEQARQMIRTVSRQVPLPMLAAHFHDTYGQALANLYAVLQEGITVIDSAVAGLGGCPYARGASGNVATEDVLYMLNGLGIETGVDMNALLAANHYVCSRLDHINHSKVAAVLQPLHP